ncbi:MAG: hypothetical protein M3P34_10155 [Actinomycetota bacterium]|nr:hypothetical protein [Actinomycetota bacterium]
MASLIDGEALEAELSRRVRPILPPSFARPTTGIVESLAESWCQDDDPVEAVAFLCGRYLDEVQDDVLFETHEKWPVLQSGGEASIFVEVANGELRIGYATRSERLDLGSIRPSQFLS